MAALQVMGNGSALPPTVTVLAGSRAWIVNSEGTSNNRVFVDRSTNSHEIADHIRTCAPDSLSRHGTQHTVGIQTGAV